ncbi:MAG: hypothetical protein ACI4B5_01995 [Bacteroidaceae bacterium]
MTQEKEGENSIKKEGEMRKSDKTDDKCDKKPNKQADYYERKGKKDLFFFWFLKYWINFATTNQAKKSLCQRE